MKKIKDILEVIAIVILFYIAAIVAFALFAIGYYWYYLVLEPWLDEVFSPWVVNEIKIIFSHPENFCFAFCMLVIFGAPIFIVIAIKVMDFVGWVKKTLVRYKK